MVSTLVLLIVYYRKRLVQFSETHLVIASAFAISMLASAGTHFPVLAVWGTVIPLVYIVIRVALWIYAMIPPGILVYSGFLLAYALEYPESLLIGAHISDLITLSILVIVGMIIAERRAVIGGLYSLLAVLAYYYLPFHGIEVMTTDIVPSGLILAVSLFLSRTDREILIYNNRFDLVFIKRSGQIYIHKTVELSSEQTYLIENVDTLLRFSEETMQMGTKVLEISDHQQKLTIYSHTTDMVCILVSSGGSTNHQKAMRRLVSITEQELCEGDFEKHLVKMALVNQ